MNNDTVQVYTKHEDVVEYLWSIDRSILNHIFYIDSNLYKKYSKYSKNKNPEMIQFCKDYNLSLGYVLHKNKHPVTINYYSSESESESDIEEDSDCDTRPLLVKYEEWSDT